MKIQRFDKDGWGEQEEEEREPRREWKKELETGKERLTETSLSR